MMADTALTRTHREPFHNSRRTDAQYRVGNRRCRPLPAMKPKRAAVDIALPCTCATEIRAAGEVLRCPVHHQAGPRLLHCCAM